MSRLNSIWKKRPTTAMRAIGNELTGVIEVPVTGLLQAEKAEMDEARFQAPDFQQKINALAVKIADLENKLIEEDVKAGKIDEREAKGKYISVAQAYQLIQDPNFKGWDDIRVKYLPELQSIWLEFSYHQSILAKTAAKTILQNRLLNKTQQISESNFAASTQVIKAIIAQVISEVSAKLKQWATENNILLSSNQISQFCKKTENQLLEKYDILTDADIDELPAALINEFYEFFKEEEDALNPDNKNAPEKAPPSEQEIREGAEKGKAESQKQIGRKSSGD